MRKCEILLGALILSICFSVASAASEKGEMSEKGLTPMGAEKGGNEDGSVPAWSGGLKRGVVDRSNSGYENPFKDEQPLFVISASTAGDFGNILTPGQKEMLERYPNTFRIPVYPTHRTAGYSQRVYDAVSRNAQNASLTAGLNGAKNYELSVPFPVLSGTPEEKAVQAIINHKTRWLGGSFRRAIVQIAPQVDGDYTPVGFEENLAFPSELEGSRAEDTENMIYYFKQRITDPPRLAGNILLIHESLDQLEKPRSAWIYNQGQRRVRRAPNVAYDGPGTASEGLRTSDNFDMYNGSLDKYEWRLIGKQEALIPYNAYSLANKSLTYEEIIRPGHLNSDLLRYEKHRVWVVEGVLKEGERHIYGRRVLYIDEDSWQIAMVDHYDRRGELWRYSEAHAMQYYDVPMMFYACEVIYDLKAGRYLVLGLNNEEAEGYDFSKTYRLRDFSPAALRRTGVR